MKVVFFSTYPPAPDGIGNYTRELRRAVEGSAPDVAIEVVAERHPAVEREIDANVERVWKRGTQWQPAATAAVIARRPDVVHIQHEEAILHQDGRLIRLLEAAGKAGIARVVTLHSIYDGRLGLPILWWPPPIFHRAIAANAEAIVVHQHAGGGDVLERQGVPPEKIQVIAHGTPHVEKWSRADARARLSLPANAKIALFLGIIHPKKNVKTVVDAAGAVAAAVPDFRLLIAGRQRQRTVIDAMYGQRLARAMAPGRAAGWLDFRPGHIAEGDVPIYFAAADVVLFPYDQSYGSASGVFHLALGAGRACIFSSSPKFGEAREIFAGLPVTAAPARDVPSWERAMITLLSSESMRAEAEVMANAGAAASAWPVLGARYAQLYRDVAGRRPQL